jgi:cysteine-rich repeat protein
MLAVLGAIGGAQLSCRVGPYGCDDDLQCELDGRTGTCAALGWCAYADDACATGVRFSAHAGDGLANHCVDETADGSGSSTMDAPASSSSGAVATGCGDGTTDEGEECDDGNDRDGDGCNVDCRRSGATMWTATPSDGAAAAIASMGTQAIVVGSLDDDGATRSLVLALDDRGVLAWGPLLEDGAAGYRRARGVAIDELGAWAVGEEDGAGSRRAWAVRYDEGGVELERVVLDTPGDDAFVTVVGGELAIAGGLGDGSAWLRGLADDFEQLDPDRELRALAGRRDGALAGVYRDLYGLDAVHVLAPGGATSSVHPALTDASVIALARLGDVVLAAGSTLRREHGDGSEPSTIELDGAPVVIAIVEHDDDDLGLAGTLGTGDAARPWIARLAPDLSLRWSRTLDDAPAITLVDADRTDDGGWLLLGRDPAATAIWVARTTP